MHQADRFVGNDLLECKDESKGENAGNLSSTTTNRNLLLSVLSRLDATVALSAVVIILIQRFSSLKPVYIPSLNLLDDSWVIDAAYRCSRGNWLVRDVVFTYGPLYELMVGLPSRLAHRTDIGFLYLSARTIPLVICIACVYGICALLLHAEPVWKRLFFFVLLIFFWCPSDMRPVLVAFILAVILRSLAIPRGRGTVLRAAILSGLVVGAFLVSSDTGVYAAAALAIGVSTSFCIERQSRREIARFALAVLSLTIVWILVANAILAHWFDFRLWRDMAAVVSNYRWGLPIGMNNLMMRGFVLTFCASILTFRIAWRYRQTDINAITRTPVFLCAGFLSAILCLQSGLVRSDWEHFSPSIFLAVTMIGLVLVGTGPKSYPWGVTLAGLALAASLCVAFVPTPRLWQSRLLRTNWNLALIEGDCPLGTKYFQRACLSSLQAEILSRTSEFLRQSRADQALIFPYQNVFAVAAGKLAAGEVLQTYAANGRHMMARQVASLKENPPELAIYGADDVASWRIDRVSSFTRSPKVWFFLQKNYQWDSVVARGYLGLRRDGERPGRWTESRQPAVDLAPQILTVVRPGVYSLGYASLATPYDFLRIELRLNYPPWWKLTKPSSVALLLHFSDGSVKVVPGVFPPNEDTEFWIYPWDDLELANYFLPDPQRWRTNGHHTALREIQLAVAPYDMFSVMPSTIAIHKIEAVRIDLKLNH